ncbi:MAG: hypothetical protein ACAI44_21360 [Candidatus Sericytochromatia bacterium]
MNKSVLVILATLTLGGLLAYPGLSQNPPRQTMSSHEGWRYPQSENYRTSFLPAEQGTLVEGLRPGPQDFTTLVRSVQPGPYHGRIRLSGQIRSEGLEGWAGLWMRVDGPANKVLGFDNMQERAIQGTTPWRNYSVVLEVPPEAENISLGFLLSGQGKAWVRNIKYEKVEASVPSTDSQPKFHDLPQNLELK